MKTKKQQRGSDCSVTDMVIEEPSFTVQEFIEALYDCLRYRDSYGNMRGLYLRPSQIGQLIAKLEEL